MRRWTNTVVAAVIGGSITAAVLLAAGAVDGGETESARATLLGGSAVATPGAVAGAVLNARRIYERKAPGVVFVRAQTVRTEPTPFDVDETTGATEATGSGFVIDADGLILTNAHVVMAATDIDVTFSGASTVSARAIGKDPHSDLALLRVDPEGLDLEPLELGDSKEVRIGDPALAIGNPSGLERTLTTGMISALRRSLTAPGGFTIENVLQTDATLDPGYSGGPLLDASGRVIGINSQIATGSGAGVGIGFAVPVDIAKDVIPQLEATGHVER